MDKAELMAELSKIELGLAENYNHYDKFTRDKIAKAIDILIELENCLKSSD